MKHKDLLKIALVLTMVASAGTAFASCTITTSTLMGGGTFSPSSNVSISVASSISSYSAYSQHLNGNRYYWACNSDPKLYYNTKNAGTTISVTPNSTDTAPSGFSSL
jgi:hypothetical protein